MAMEHHKAIVLLFAKELHGSALSLMRLIVEAYVRGVWLHECANEKEIQSFIRGEIPEFYKLVEAIEKLGGREGNALSKFKTLWWKSLNSFTHTGFDQVVRRQNDESFETNYDGEELLTAVISAGFFGSLAAIGFCQLGNNGEIACAILNRIKDDWAMQ